MSELSAQFELVEFEQVEAGPDTALLRLVARPSAEALAGPLTLVIERGGESSRHLQLPALPGPPTLLRVGFSVALAQLGSGARFALELSDHTRIELPEPARRRRT